MWSGPWQRWKDVPKDDKDRLFERFQCYFQWEEQWNAKIYSYWEKCNAGKFANMLSRVRKAAIAMARTKDVEVRDNMSLILNYKPAWMRMEAWQQLIEIWNTPEWKAKSTRNTDNRKKSTGGKHTLGSQTFVSAKLKAAKRLGREIPFPEMWRQSHCRKGFRPLDKLVDKAIVEEEEVDLEETLQEHDSDWVDERSLHTLTTYEGYLLEKYGDDANKNPKFDLDLWTRAGGGRKKGKLYGLSNVSDPLGLIIGTPSTLCGSTLYVNGRQHPEIQKLNRIIEELVKEKEEERERMNGKIEELIKEKEKDKMEKNAILDRMTNVEAFIKLMSQNIPPPS